MNNSTPTVESGSRPAPRWSLRLFGGFELGTFPTGDKVVLPGKRERALLAYLALSPKGRQPRRKLAALIWGDATDQTLLDNLRTCVWRLRKALGDSEHRLLASDDEDIVLDLAAFNIDALAFRRLAAQAGQAELEAAARLCRGEFLDGFELDSEEFESWRRTERSHYLDQSIELLSRLMKLLMESAQTERAIETGARILGLDPLHEATARHMMLLYADCGRRGAAIQLYRALSEALLRDVNMQPEAETRHVFSGIARSDGTEPPPPASDEIDASSPPSRAAPSRKWSLPLIAVTVASIAMIALGAIWWMDRGAGVALAGHSAAAPMPIAVVVLPFRNLSDDPADQSFSDGMTEELSAALAKVPGLQIIARASAFRFRDKDARRAAAQLGVRYVVEGTIRRNNDGVRITARLVPTHTGEPLWSRSYERGLGGMVITQEELVADIARALKLSPGSKILSSGHDIDPVSYEQFLRALPLIRARQTGVPQAIQILEPLVARNPDFAPAWALLAYCYGLMPALSPLHIFPYSAEWKTETRKRIEEFWPKADAAARRAIRLNPGLPEAYLALGVLEHFRGNLLAADKLFVKAQGLDPYNPDVLAWRMNLLADVGRLKEALAAAQQLMALDPYVPSWKQDASEVFWVTERYDTAIEMLQSILDRPSGAASLARVYASQGRYTEAADAIETSLKVRGEYIPGQSLRWRTTAGLLRAAPARAPLPPVSLRLGQTSFVYLYVGAPERALEVYEDDVTAGLAGGHGVAFSYVWHPSYAPARKTERFKSLMRDAGMVDYWRQRGWPGFCRPLSGQDFACT